MVNTKHDKPQEVYYSPPAREDGIDRSPTMEELTALGLLRRSAQVQ